MATKYMIPIHCKDADQKAALHMAIKRLTLEEGGNQADALLKVIPAKHKRPKK